MDEKFAALSRLLERQANSDDLDLLRRALTRGEISIGGDTTNSVILIGSSNTVTLTAEARQLLQPEEVKDEPAPGESPYKGLLYFDVTDAPLFFGREALTHDLTARLKREPLLAIVGASGSGKSSLARAGLIPAWSEEHAGQVDVHIVTPGVHPLESLAISLTRYTESVTAAETLVADLRQSPRSLRLYVRRLLQKDKSRILLLVDQFEETFTLCKDAEERQAFIENLLGLVEEGGEEVRLIFTLRADFYHHCANYEGLRRALQDHQAFIGAMNREELRRAILAPAEAGAWDFQPGLVELILNDVGEEPGALPLLSHALLETWKRRRGRMLTLQGYAEAGGVKQAIARTAEQVYEAMNEEEQQVARAIFMRLTELGEGTPDTRRRAAFTELYISTSDTETIKHVLNILTETRLLTTSQDGVEVAHEALIREWGTLRRWLDEDRESLRTHRRLTEAAAEWEHSGRDETYLVHRAGRLEDALALHHHPVLRLSETEGAYLIACLNLQERQRRERELRSRLTVIASLAAAVIFLMLGFFGWQQSQVANNRAEEAARNLAVAQTAQIEAEEKTRQIFINQLTSQIQTRFNQDTADETAILLAIQLMHTLPNPEAAQVLQNNILAFPVISLNLISVAKDIEFSPDGRYMVTLRDERYTVKKDEILQVWDTTTWEQVASMAQEEEVSSVAFSPDGNYIVSGGGDGTVRVWETETGNEVGYIVHGDSVNRVAFSPGGHYIASAGCDKRDENQNCIVGTIKVWETPTRRNVTRLTHDSDVNFVGFSPDGHYIVSGSGDHTVRVWETFTGREVSRMAHNSSVTYVDISPNGTYLVSAECNEQGPFYCVLSSARVWEMYTGHELARIIHNSEITAVDFSPDGRFVATGALDGHVRISYASSGLTLHDMMHDGYVWTLEFSPNGKYLVSGGSDGARLWDVEAGEEIARMRHSSDVGAVAFSSDGRYVATADDLPSQGGYPKQRSLLIGGAVKIWRLSMTNEIPIKIHNDFIEQVIFSPDGHFVLSGSADNTACVWNFASFEKIICKAHTGDVNFLSFSPEGEYVISADGDESYISYPELAIPIRTVVTKPTVITVWEALTGNVVSTIETERAFVDSFSISPGGYYVALGSWDNSVSVWEIFTGRKIFGAIHDGAVRSVAFSPDERYLVSGSNDNTVRVWELTSGQEIARITHESEVTFVGFSNDGRYIISIDSNEIAQIYEIRSEHSIDRIAIENGLMPIARVIYKYGITSFDLGPYLHYSISPDGKYLIGTGDNGILQVWEIQTEREIIRLRQPEGIRSFTLSPDGHYLITGGWDGTIRVWLYRPEDLIADACARVTRNLTRAEWAQYIGDLLPYHAVCPNLPLEP